MPSPAQINANRLNSQKSTGPTSPEGKATSSLNALKSGIDAWSHIIPGEDPAELEALTAAFVLHFHPSDPVQLSLVDTLISAEWIQRRLRRIEAQLWNYQIECLDKNLSHADFLDASIQHNSPLGHAFHAALDPFSRIQRRIDGTNRMYLRTLKALQDLQAAAEPAEPFPPETPISASPSPMPAQPLTPQIGFVPQSAAESESPIRICGRNATSCSPTLAACPTAHRGGGAAALSFISKRATLSRAGYPRIFLHRRPSHAAQKPLCNLDRCAGKALAESCIGIRPAFSRLG